MTTRFALALGCVAGLTLSSLPAAAQQSAAASPEAVAKVVAQSWRNLSPELQARVDQDKAATLCSLNRNQLPKAQAEEIVKEAKAGIVYPTDGKFMGDWKKGERGALDGYGMRMGDNPKRANGGNCYACHQLSPKEISFGTLGPPLLAYGKAKGSSEAAQKEVYEKIYNAQSTLACSNMPRFGHHKVLSIEQIKDYVALLLDPESPVNKGQ
jgi:sulfur-oxidizing protein SoxX